MLTKITVADYMTQNFVKLTKEMSVIDAIKQTLSHKITGAPVVDAQGTLVGMFFEKDALKVVVESAYHQSAAGTVEEFMTQDVTHVDAESSIVDLAENFQNCAVRSFPVYRESKLVGVISRTDVLRALVSDA